MSRLFATALVIALTAPALAQALAPAFAQGAGPVASRQALMKQNGKDAKAGGEMLKGVTPFDAAKAEMIFADMRTVAGKFGTYVPKGSETGGDTEAAPAIWAKPAAFKAALAKFQQDTAAAVAAKPATLAAFGQQFSAVTANCKSCHEAFRVKKT